MTRVDDPLPWAGAELPLNAGTAAALHVWLRAETRPDEHRAPLAPADAAVLIGRGARVTVEESAERVFDTAEYAAAGCSVAPAGTWPLAPVSAVVLGLKELPDSPHSLCHRHVYFAHAYKRQTGADQLLGRFTSGGGELLDLEYLVDEQGRREVAFGYWAGYVGAALAVLRAADALTTPLLPRTAADLAEEVSRVKWRGRALVVGALGRCGRGAIAAFADAGVEATAWDVAETAELDTAALLQHDVLVNTVLAATPGKPLLSHANLGSARRRLRVVADVSCDVTSDCNMLPIYEETTTWAEPVHTLSAGADPLYLIAIDNLPSLVPVDASTAFSQDLAPLLPLLPRTAGPWARAQQSFHLATEEPRRG